MKKISVVAALLVLASCGHQPVADSDSAFDRKPSNTTEIMSCGLLGSAETARNAVDVNISEKIDDRIYSLQIDCNRDRVVHPENERLIVGIPANLVRSSQKGWITRWRKTAVKAQKNPAAKPYVCMNYQAAYDPCAANKNVHGYAPKFSSKVLVGQKIK